MTHCVRVCVSESWWREGEDDVDGFLFDLLLPVCLASGSARDFASVVVQQAVMQASKFLSTLTQVQCVCV